MAEGERWPSREQVESLRLSIVEDMQTSEEGFAVAASPYRICPLGAHVDHQGGDVTAMALDRGLLLGFVPSDGPIVKLRSRQFPSEEITFSILGAGRRHHDWGDYARGAAMALASRNYAIKRGIVGLIDGCEGMDGCGISSSAAVGVAFLLALEHVNGLEVSPLENVELDRLIENQFLGLRNGVLDPSAILLSRRGYLTVVHCRTRRYELLPAGSAAVASGFRILLAFSGLQHALASRPGFNQRVNECRIAAKELLAVVGRTVNADDDEVDAVLSSITAEEYASHGWKLKGNIAKRARHFFTEVARVEAGARAWVAGDMVGFGRLVTQSGRSSIDDYECGCEELVQLWKIVVAAPGVLGARFSGAGFRGCVLGIVRADEAQAAASVVSDEYRRLQPMLWSKIRGQPVVVCEPGDCARLLVNKV